jgi:hypothetical protein
MALDWIQEIERRLHEKICGRLTWCGGEEEAGSEKGAHICSWRGQYHAAAQAVVFADPVRKLCESIMGSRYFGLVEGG